MKWWWVPSEYRYVASALSMRTVRYLSPLRKLCSKIDPVSRLRSLALMTAPARASLMCSTLTTSSSWPSISNIVPLRKSLVEIIGRSLLGQVLHREQVAGEPKAGDHTASRASRHALRSKLLARVDVGDVNLNGRNGERLQAIEQGQRVVRERGGIDDDARRRRCFLLKEGDDLAFIIALKEVNLDVQLSRLDADRVHQVGQRPCPVDVGLALAEQVQVGAVDDEEPLHASALRTNLRTTPAGTMCPGSAWPRRRGITQATRPRRAFLSCSIAARTRAGSTAGGRSGNPYSVSSASCASTRRDPHSSNDSAIFAATRMPKATARPWDTRNRLAASSAWPAVWP